MNDFILGSEVGREESPQLNNHNWEKYYSQERKSIAREKLIFLSVCDGKGKKYQVKSISCYLSLLITLLYNVSETGT